MSIADGTSIDARKNRKTGFYRVRDAKGWLIAFFNREDRLNDEVTKNEPKDWHTWYAPMGSVTYFIDPWLEIDETPIDVNKTSEYDIKLQEVINKQFAASHKKISPAITSSEIDNVDNLVSIGLASELWSSDDNAVLYVFTLSQIVSTIRSVRVKN